MTKKDWSKVITAGIASVFLGMVVLSIVIYNTRKKKLGTKKLNDIIKDDIDYWDGITETSQKGAEKLSEWWKIVGQNYSVSQLRSPSFQSNHFWSAVYISSVMKRWGAGERFLYSARHSDFICDGIKARNSEDENKIFWSYRPDQVSINVGDIIGLARASWVNFDNLCAGAPTHTDIVFRIDKTKDGYKAIVSGGNLANTRKTSYVDLDKNKKIVNPDKYLAVLKNKVT